MKYKIEITRKITPFREDVVYHAKLYKRGFFLFIPDWVFLTSEFEETEVKAKEKVIEKYLAEEKVKRDKTVINLDSLD